MRVRLLIVGLWKWTALHGAKFDIDYYWSDEDSDEDDDEATDDAAERVSEPIGTGGGGAGHFFPYNPSDFARASWMQYSLSLMRSERSN